MSFPAEGVESAIKNSIEDVRLFLDSRHPGHYAVYNLSKRSYRPSRFHNRVCRSAFPPNVCLARHLHMYDTGFWFSEHIWFVKKNACRAVTPDVLTALLCPAQVSECGWQARRAPNLRNLYSICKNMHQWLKQDQRNICVVHCLVRNAKYV